MPINVTVTFSGKILLQETITKMRVFTLAASRLNSKLYLFSLGVVPDYIRFLFSFPNSKLNGYNMSSRL